MNSSLSNFYIFYRIANIYFHSYPLRFWDVRDVTSWKMKNLIEARYELVVTFFEILFQNLMCGSFDTQMEGFVEFIMEWK